MARRGQRYAGGNAGPTHAGGAGRPVYLLRPVQTPRRPARVGSLDTILDFHQAEVDLIDISVSMPT
jgi:hypothetical protein